MTYVSPMAAQIIGNLRYIGFFDFVLPWLFAFAVVYGILKSAKIFDSLDKVQVIISMVIAFFLTNYTPYGTSIGDFFSNLYGMGMFIIAGLLLIVLMLGLVFGEKWQEVFTKPLELILKIFGFKESASQLIAIGLVLIGIGVAVLLFAAHNFGLSFSTNMHVSSDVVATGLVLGSVILAVVFLTKG